MENSSIRSPQKPALANQAARHAGVRQASGNEADSSGPQLGFSQVLADVATPSLAASPGEEVDALPSAPAGMAVEWSGLTPQAMAEAGMFSLASLVGQTARMDGAADAAQRDGRVQADSDGTPGPAALPMGAGPRAAGPGLQTLHPKGAGADAGAGTGTALDQGAAATLETTTSPQAPSTLSLTQAASGVERSTPPSGLAALLAQMQAVPAAAADLAATPKSGTAGIAAAAESGAAPVGTVALADTVAHKPAEGAEAAADAVLSPPDEAQADALSEQVAFWVQQKTQRAEMTIDRQGQPVKVQVVVTGNEAHVTFRSNEQQTRDMLDASTAQLRELLEQQGLTLAGVSVQTADAGRQDAGGASSGRDSSGRSPAQREAGDAPLTAMVSADLRARPDALRAVDLFV